MAIARWGFARQADNILRDYLDSIFKWHFHDTSITKITRIVDLMNFLN
jgi:hypothetical protein